MAAEEGFQTEKEKKRSKVGKREKRGRLTTKIKTKTKNGRKEKWKGGR